MNTNRDVFNIMYESYHGVPNIVFLGSSNSFKIWLRTADTTLPIRNYGITIT